jgi:hypothetical protein
MGQASPPGRARREETINQGDNTDRGPGRARLAEGIAPGPGGRLPRARLYPRLPDALIHRRLAGTLVIAIGACGRSARMAYAVVIRNDGERPGRDLAKLLIPAQVHVGWAAGMTALTCGVR